MASVLEAVAGVPAPDVPLRPGVYTPSTLSIVLGAVAVVGVVMFVVSVLSAQRRVRNPVLLWAPVVLPLVLLAGGIGAAYVSSQRDEARHDQAWDEWRLAAEAARPGVIRALETTYGITIIDPVGFPVAPDDVGSFDVILSSGEQVECSFEAEGVYVVTCITSSAGGFTPLQPVQDHP